MKLFLKRKGQANNMETSWSCQGCG